MSTATPPLVIAHRGASADAPENTMTSFRRAWDSTPWIETDVQPSADGVPVLIHDDDVDRTTDGTGPVRSQTADTLRGLDAGTSHSPDFVGARIPLLTELLDRVASDTTDDRRVLLEIKGEHTSDQLRTILDAIDRAGVADHIQLQSFDVPSLQRLRALHPDDPLGLLVEHLDDDPIDACHEIDAAMYNPDVEELLARPDRADDVITALHAAGIAVMPWTANDPDQWDRLVDLAVDGIITDRPGELTRHLAVTRRG